MENLKPKSFWERPEGTTGMIFAVGIVGGGILILYKFLPFFITLLQNTLYAGILIVALAALAYVVFDKKTRTLVWYIYQSIMKAITRMFVKIDPIPILESYVEHLEESLSKMDQHLSNLKGKMRELKNLIDGNASQMQSQMKLASQAKQQGKIGYVVLSTRKAGRLKESNMSLQSLYSKMEITYRVLNKMYENASILKEDIKDNVDVKKRELEAIRASYGALQSARAIISGDSDKKAIFDMAMEATAEEVGMKIGEMDRFMEVSQGVIDGIDLQNGIFEEDGIKMLEKWENESTSILLGDTKSEIIAQSYDPNQVLDIEKEKVPVSKSGKKSSYNKILS
jgi:ABC-type multidrug transport system fused ATPase/permease subunit